MDIWGTPDERDWGYEPPPFWPILLGIGIACLILVIIDNYVKS